MWYLFYYSVLKNWIISSQNYSLENIFTFSLIIICDSPIHYVQVQITFERFCALGSWRFCGVFRIRRHIVLSHVLLLWDCKVVRTPRTFCTVFYPID